MEDKKAIHSEQVKTKKAVQKCVNSLECYQPYPRDLPKAKKIDLALAEMIALEV